jgi:hypothetical protein
MLIVKVDEGGTATGGEVAMKLGFYHFNLSRVLDWKKLAQGSPSRRPIASL